MQVILLWRGGGRGSPQIINMNRDVFQVTGINRFEKKKLTTIWSNFFEMYSSLNINVNHQWTPKGQLAITVNRYIMSKRYVFGL